MTTETPPALPFRSPSEILTHLDQHGQEYAVVQAPELGSSFRVRGLSRMESQRIGHLTTDRKTGNVDQARGDWLMLEAALAEPKLTRQDFDALRMHTPALPRRSTASSPRSWNSRTAWRPTWARRRTRLAPGSGFLSEHPDVEMDFHLFHAAAGRWESVEHMRACLSQLEWYRHFSYLRRRTAEQQKEAARLQRQASRGRR